MWRSGELPRLDELDHSHSFSAYESKQNECGPPGGLAPVLEVSANEENGVKTSNSLKDAPEVPKLTVTSSRLSDESTCSNNSFAFPV